MSISDVKGDHMDILFKNDDFVFSYRVGGILIHNEKILLQRPKNDDYAIIGGHVAAMETSMETLKREFEEELHAEIEVDNLLAIGEIYFPWGKSPCHQICLYYNVHLLDDSIPMDGCFMDMMNWIMRESIWISAGFRWRNIISPIQIVTL